MISRGDSPANSCRPLPLTTGCHYRAKLGTSTTLDLVLLVSCWRRDPKHGAERRRAQRMARSLACRDRKAKHHTSEQDRLIAEAISKPAEQELSRLTSSSGTQRG